MTGVNAREQNNNSNEYPVLYGSLILTASCFFSALTVRLCCHAFALDVAFSVWMFEAEEKYSFPQLFLRCLPSLFPFSSCQNIFLFSIVSRFLFSLTNKNVYKRFHVAILFNLIFIYFSFVVLLQEHKQQQKILFIMCRIVTRSA